MKCSDDVETTRIPVQTMREIVYGADEERDMLERAWGLAVLPMVNTHYTQAVLQFLRGGLDSGVCPRRLAMFELATVIASMHDACLEALVTAWHPRRRRAETLGARPRALRGVA